MVSAAHSGCPKAGPPSRVFNIDTAMRTVQSPRNALTTKSNQMLHVKPSSLKQGKAFGIPTKNAIEAPMLAKKPKRKR